MLNNSFKNISSIALLLSLTIMIGCGHLGGTQIAPNTPTVKTSESNVYENTTTVAIASLPPNAVPVKMYMAGLTADEADKGVISQPIGVTKQMSVDIELEGGKYLKGSSSVNWSVSNEEVGTITSKGLFSPLKEGRVKIIASIAGVSATVNIDVTSAMNMWTQVNSPTSNTLNDVVVVNESEAWAVGDGGTILRYLNGNWTNISLYEKIPSVNLTGVDVIRDTNEVWAVGGSYILKFDGTRWTQFPYTGGGNLKSIDMLSANEGWAVGEKDGAGYVLRYTNGTWQEVQTKIKHRLNSVSALSPIEVYVGGLSGSLAAPAVYKYDGTEWAQAKFSKYASLLDKLRPWDGTYEVKSIKMLNSTQGWFVGERTPIASTIRGTRGFMFYYNSIEDRWEEGTFDSTVADLNQVPLRDVGMIAGTKGWVLGTNTTSTKLFDKQIKDIQGGLLSSDGKNLKVDTNYEANTVGTGFNAIDLLPNGNGIIVGDAGFIMHHQFDISRESYSYGSSTSSSYANYGYSTGTNSTSSSSYGYGY